MKQKRCSKCKKLKPISEFSKHTAKKDGLSYYCKECVRVVQRKFNKTAKRREYNKQYYEQYKKTGYFKKYSQRPEVKKRKAIQMRIYRNDPNQRLKHEARWQISHRITSGDIIKPKNCSKCKSTEAVQAHHPDYSMPLMVIWLCRMCHIKLHAKAKALPHQA